MVTAADDAHDARFGRRFGCTCLSLDVVTAAAESHDARLGRVLVLVADAHDAQYLPQLKLMMLYISVTSRVDAHDAGLGRRSDWQQSRLMLMMLTLACSNWVAVEVLVAMLGLASARGANCHGRRS